MIEKLEQGHKAGKMLCRDLTTILFCYSFLSRLKKLGSEQHNLTDGMGTVCNPFRELKVIQVDICKRPWRGR